MGSNISALLDTIFEEAALQRVGSLPKLVLRDAFTNWKNGAQKQASLVLAWRLQKEEVQKQEDLKLI